ncbi:uncharacterized protein SCHCODRAFT_02597869 [Schizophyllum commune H4-8]|uniref:Uncharacterized protein n=1 Tax=Schizophyllum commune (strain H4-8 / FGSC 9210) TaxID=578458 RepID=D8PXW0_SCHCM|nr:uncharacterized protein SCHCODRAFT_02597869 [Schizophyllum commune H4-8]KAI5897073.1 hypothetical protein SCHCODRAFT_02597869 [Schizophyllum commune H4-8]
MSKRPATPGMRASPALSKKSRSAKVFEIESDSEDGDKPYRLRDVSDSAGTRDIPSPSTDTRKTNASTKAVADVGLTTAQRLQEARKASEQYKTLAHKRLNRIAGAVAKVQQSDQAVAAANAKMEAMDGEVRAAKAAAAVSEAKVTVLQSEVVELACECEDLRQMQAALTQLLECTVCYASSLVVTLPAAPVLLDGLRKRSPLAVLLVKPEPLVCRCPTIWLLGAVAVAYVNYDVPYERDMILHPTTSNLPQEHHWRHSAAKDVHAFGPYREVVVLGGPRGRVSWIIIDTPQPDMTSLSNHVESDVIQPSVNLAIDEAAELGAEAGIDVVADERILEGVWKTDQYKAGAQWKRETRTIKLSIARDRAVESGVLTIQLFDVEYEDDTRGTELDKANTQSSQEGRACMCNQRHGKTRQPRLLQQSTVVLCVRADARLLVQSVVREVLLKKYGGNEPVGDINSERWREHSRPASTRSFNLPSSTASDLETPVLHINWVMTERLRCSFSKRRVFLIMHEDRWLKRGGTVPRRALSSGMLETAPPVTSVLDTRQDATQRAPSFHNNPRASLDNTKVATIAPLPTPTHPHPSYSTHPLPVADHAAKDRHETRVPTPPLQTGTEESQKKQADDRVLSEARPIVVNKPNAKSGAGSNTSACTGELCRVNPSPGKLNQKCSRRVCKACCQHVMRNSPDTEGRCALNHHNLARDTPEIDEDRGLRRRGRGPVPPPSAVAQRPDGDTRAIRLDSHAGYVALSWERTLADSSWQRTPTDGLDARKERRALDSSVQVYWWLHNDEEPAKMSLRTDGHATFLPSTYAEQMRRLVPDMPTDLSVFGAYNVEICEWTQTELAQKIPYQRVLFLRSSCVRRTPGLEQRVSTQFKLGGATPGSVCTPTHSAPSRKTTPTPMFLGRMADSYEARRSAQRDCVPDPRRMLAEDSGAQIVPEYGLGIEDVAVSSEEGTIMHPVSARLAQPDRSVSLCLSQETSTRLVSSFTISVSRNPYQAHCLSQETRTRFVSSVTISGSRNPYQALSWVVILPRRKVPHPSNASPSD